MGTLTGRQGKIVQRQSFRRYSFTDTKLAIAVAPTTSVTTRFTEREHHNVGTWLLLHVSIHAGEPLHSEFTHAGQCDNDY